MVQEHVVLDDNGDGRGTGTDKSKRLRADSPTPDGLLARDIRFFKAQSDPLPAAARDKRAERVVAIEVLRKQKASLRDDNYHARLGKLMRETAKLYGKSK